MGGNDCHGLTYHTLLSILPYHHAIYDDEPSNPCISIPPLLPLNGTYECTVLWFIPSTNIIYRSSFLIHPNIPLITHARSKN